MKKKKIKIPLKLISMVVLSFAAFFILVYFSWRYLTIAEYFTIKDSEYFSGKNIFQIDLQAKAKELNRKYPDYKQVVLRRQLPDGISVELSPRHALARIKLGGDEFYVDEEGVLFYSKDEQAGLPLLLGLDSRISSSRRGAKYNIAVLNEALRFISNLLVESALAQALQIQTIDLANSSDIVLFSASGCRINLGASVTLERKLATLQKLISELEPDLSRIDYIDLRFREPAVKYR